MSDFLSRFRRREDEDPLSGTPLEPPFGPPTTPEDAPQATGGADGLPRIEQALREEAAARRRLEQRQTALELALEELRADLAMVARPAAPNTCEVRQSAAKRSLPDEAWEAAPLPLRLQFVRGLLQAEHPLHTSLTEAAALVDLWSKGGELESWIRGYPALFADAYTRLQSPGGSDGSAAARLAEETIREARALLDGGLRALGMEWIDPRPGEEIAEAHAVVAEEGSAEAPPGRVAGLRRRGLRWRGGVHLPAQVTRSTPGAPMAAPPEISAPQTPASTDAPASRTAVTDPPASPLPQKSVTAPPHAQAPPASTDTWPEFLRTLHRKGLASAPPAAREVVQGLTTLAGRAGDGAGKQMAGQELWELVQPLLPLLGQGLTEVPPEWSEALASVRGDALAWLRDEFGLEVVVPSERSLFVPGVMEATGERRTAHPHEQGKVAKTERVGLLRNGQVFLPARVIRYEAGESW